MISPGKEYVTRNKWRAEIDAQINVFGLDVFIGNVFSPLCGYWIACTWTLEGKCWYGEQLDIEETK